jgi:acetoacetyl-CoA synthetase
MDKHDPNGLSPKPLWQQKDPTTTRLYEFSKLIEAEYNVKLDTYEELRQWSIENLNKFWGHVWDFTHVRASTPFTEVVHSSTLPSML